MGQLAEDIGSILGDNGEPILQDLPSRPPAALEDDETEVEEVEVGEEVAEAEEVEAAEVENEDEEALEAESEVEEEPDQKFERLEEFAEALDISYEELLDGIKTKIKIDGEEIPVTLKELHSGYQKEADYRRKTAEVAETQRRFGELVDNLNTQFTNRVEEIESLATELEKSFMEDYENIDWAKIRAEDPGNYAALQQDMEVRKQQLQTAKLKAYREKQEQMRVWNERLVNVVVPAERQKLAEYNPDWMDQSKWNGDYQNILKNLVENYQFSPQEASAVYDSRSLRVAWDALRYRNSLKTKEQSVERIKEEAKAEKRNRLSKKTLRPGAKKANTSVKSKRIETATKRLKRSGSVEDAASLILERMR